VKTLLKTELLAPVFIGLNAFLAAKNGLKTSKMTHQAGNIASLPCTA
jgi:hypothetical protein